jgi:hypothetical protein
MNRYSCLYGRVLGTGKNRVCKRKYHQIDVYKDMHGVQKNSSWCISALCFSMVGIGIISIYLSYLHVHELACLICRPQSRSLFITWERSTTDPVSWSQPVLIDLFSIVRKTPGMNL